MIWTYRRLARQPGIALGASAVSATVTLIATIESVGRPMHWITLITLFSGGLISGMGIAKAKREWHDAWVRQTFTDFVIAPPREHTEPIPSLVFAPAGGSAEKAAADRVLSLPHDGPDADVILSLPHEPVAAGRKGREG